MPAVTLLQGEASFLGGHRLHVADQATGRDREVRAGWLVPATGSRPPACTPASAAASPC